MWALILNVMCKYLKFLTERNKQSKEKRSVKTIIKEM